MLHKKLIPIVFIETTFIILTFLMYFRIHDFLIHTTVLIFIINLLVTLNILIEILIKKERYRFSLTHGGDYKPTYYFETALLIFAIISYILTYDFHVHNFLYGNLILLSVLLTIETYQLIRFIKYKDR